MVVQQILHQVCRLTLRHVLRVAVGAFQKCRIRMTQQGCRHLFAGAFLQQITYVYKKGLLDGDYSFSTAVGLFNTVINVILLIAVNKVVAKMNDGQGL